MRCVDDGVPEVQVVGDLDRQRLEPEPAGQDRLAGPVELGEDQPAPAALAVVVLHLQRQRRLAAVHRSGEEHELSHGHHCAIGQPCGHDDQRDPLLGAGQRTVQADQRAGSCGGSRRESTTATSVRIAATHVADPAPELRRDRRAEPTLRRSRPRAARPRRWRRAPRSRRPARRPRRRVGRARAPPAGRRPAPRHRRRAPGSSRGPTGRPAATSTMPWSAVTTSRQSAGSVPASCSTTRSTWVSSRSQALDSAAAAGGRSRRGRRSRRRPATGRPARTASLDRGHALPDRVGTDVVAAAQPELGQPDAVERPRPDPRRPTRQRPRRARRRSGAAAARAGRRSGGRRSRLSTTPSSGRRMKKPVRPCTPGRHAASPATSG